MNKVFAGSVVAFCSLAFFALSVGAASLSVPADPAAALESMPPAFTVNMGQWDEAVLFRADLSGAAMWITADGVYYEFVRRVPRADVAQAASDTDHRGDTFETLVLKASLVGADPQAAASGTDPLDYRCNYFLGNDPGRWRSNVASYRTVLLQNVYPGIDVTYYGHDGRLEYDFRVRAGADPARIRIEYEGADSVSVSDDGALIVATAWGELHELPPVVYQEARGSRRPVTAAYRKTGRFGFSFELGPEFDPALPVTIDPVLVYSTYIGGGINDAGRAVAVDSTGAAYLTGETFSSTFPVQNPYQSTRPGYLSAFVTKLSRGGNALVYSTYLGGTITDAGFGVAVNAQGQACVVGSTSSADFPIIHALQPSFGGGSSDAFVAKLSSGGDSLLWSTFLGGDGLDSGEGLTVDSAGNVYLTGFAASTDLPTLNAYSAVNSGEYDAFAAKITRNGALVYSTYLGGTGDDKGSRVAVDRFGRAHIAGRTKSTNFPAVGGYQNTLASLEYLDAFITMLSASGANVVYSTYLGGSRDDYAYDIALDFEGTACITGRTVSVDFPVVNAWQTENHGAFDAFVARLLIAENLLEYSSYLGGTADDYGYALALDDSSYVHVAGRTFSTDFPTVNAYQADFQGGASDAFVTRLSPAGQLLSNTYLGGSGFDGAYDLDFDTAGAVYVTGYTDSDDFPTRNPYQATWKSGGADLFVTKLADLAPCCSGRVGDANGAGGDEPTIGDISVLIAALFITGDLSSLPCMSEADVNQSGADDPGPEDITISDISILIDYLFISGAAVATLHNCL